jgi:small-conductance mechanosensitive channel
VELLELADELERRDAALARALASVEALQSEIEDVRARTAEVAAFLASLPELMSEREADEHAAAAAREDAAAAVRAADATITGARKESARLEAERVRADAADGLASAELWLAQARRAREALAREGDARRAGAERLHAQAAELAPRVRDVPPPPDGIDGAHTWASQARGALLLEHSNLAREREAVIREASELVASVTGDPLASAAVAGVRDRLALALSDPSA